MIRLTVERRTQTGTRIAACALAISASTIFALTIFALTIFALTIFALAGSSSGQAGQRLSNGETQTTQGAIRGHVRDTAGKLIANATVYLEAPAGSSPPVQPTQITHTDPAGEYHFFARASSAYSLRATMAGYASATSGPFELAQEETKEIDLALTTSSDKASAAADAAFFDEPHFTVAGVTQAANAGGHGSDTVSRTTEALAKATVSLSEESAGSAKPAPVASESSLRNLVHKEPDNSDANRELGKFLANEGKSAEAVSYLVKASLENPGDAETHRLLGAAEEAAGQPLEAVREFQRAAELAPTEPDFFDWGAELLEHRALEPASEVFAKGNRLFPDSTRMQVARCVAWYAREFDDQAAECLVQASDHAPEDSTPYLFMGQMLNAEIAPSEATVARLARFAKQQPENALANYYYAVALLKRSAAVADANDSDPDQAKAIEELLQKAIRLDPRFGEAYLQLGTFYARRADDSRAIAAYQQAVTVNPDLEQTIAEAHYRLAKAYLRTGDKPAAAAQLQLHAQFSKKAEELAESQRRAIQEFVVALKDKNKVKDKDNDRNKDKDKNEDKN